MGNSGSCFFSTNIKQDYNIAKIEKKFAAKNSLESLDMTFESFHPQDQEKQQKSSKAISPNMESVRL